MIAWEAGSAELGTILDCNTISQNISGGAKYTKKKLPTSAVSINALPFLNPSSSSIKVRQIGM